MNFSKIFRRSVFLWIASTLIHTLSINNMYGQDIVPGREKTSKKDKAVPKTSAPIRQPKTMPEVPVSLEAIQAAERHSKKGIEYIRQVELKKLRLNLERQ